MYLAIILTILIGSYILNLIVDALNLKSIRPVLPDEFKGLYSEEKYAKSQEYLKENTYFKLVHGTFHILVVIAFILSGGFNFIDQIAQVFNLGSILTGLIFIGILFLGSQIIEIPFSIYHTFIIEAKYGFNRTTKKTFVSDLLKGWILTFIIGAIVLSFVIWFFETTGALAWIFCWIAVFLFEVFLIFIAPVIIMPVFNKFIPLPDGELKLAIQSYAVSQKFKMKGIFTMDGSRRSTKSNAFFTGFGKYRRIVLFDTLIERHTTDELVSVLAHEIGHYKKKHILKNMFFQTFATGFMFFILSLFIKNPSLFAAFRMEDLSVYASLLFFGFLYTPINLLLSIFGNFMSRRYEYAADKYAVLTHRNAEVFIMALKKLSVDNLSNLIPHSLKVILSYSHPPILERIKAIRDI